MRTPVDADPIRHVILDARLQRADPPRFQRLLSAFTEGYRQTFSGDEAEAAGRWPARIGGEPAPQPVLRIAVAVEGQGGAEWVVGGAAAEYYRASACVLCTYLYVSPEAGQRRRGHGRALLAAATQAFTDLGPAAAVLAEVEWPDALPRAIFGPDAVEEARSRLRFFERLDARLVALDYVQPALAAGARRPVPWLRLLLLPGATGAATERDEMVLRPVLDRFLVEFHEALAEECDAAVDTALLSAQRAQLACAARLTIDLGSGRAPD
jgi:hypothetical protein